MLVVDQIGRLDILEGSLAAAVQVEAGFLRGDIEEESNNGRKNLFCARFHHASMTSLFDSMIFNWKCDLRGTLAN